MKERVARRWRRTLRNREGLLWAGQTDTMVGPMAPSIPLPARDVLAFCISSLFLLRCGADPDANTAWWDDTATDAGHGDASTPRQRTT